MQQFALKDVRPNPFRDMSRYPINREKIAALRESLRTTGFWENLLGRLADGVPEIAYGHHRLQAMREEFGSDHTISLNLKRFTDEQMLQIMCRENQEEWESSALIDQETVRSVVEAYAAGKIILPRPQCMRDVRYAPQFTASGIPYRHDRHGDDHRFPYTVASLAEFLGWIEPGGGVKQRLYTALNALELIERKVATERDFTGLGSAQVRQVVQYGKAA
jgi:hypothetical protein